MMFTLRYPAQIVFGENTANQIVEILAQHGVTRPLLCCSHSVAKDTLGNGLKIAELLREKSVGVLSDLAPEAPIPAVQKWLEEAHRWNPDAVVALGGGTVIDAAKLLAATIPTSFSVSELFHQSQKITRKGLLFFALPTTAGTGAEITSNSVILNPENGHKLSVRHPSMIADAVIVDPCLTLGAPHDVSLYSGLDAFVQAVESFYSKNGNLYTQSIAEKAIRIFLEFLPQMNLHDLSWRTHMAEGSLLSAMAFSQSGLGAVHALAHPMGGRCHIPHGKICAILLLPVLRLNMAQGWRPANVALLAEIEAMLEKLNLPECSTLNIPKDLIPFIIENCRSNSMRSNPCELSDAILTDFLTRIL